MPQNLEDRGPDWPLFASHRAAFTLAVEAAAPASPGRVCVLGAGKCNDLDLARLAARYRELHLVDLEPASIASAIAREPPDLRAQLKPHAPVDLSILNPKRVSKWQRKSPSAAELNDAAAACLASVLGKLPGPFDVVVSACVITQLGFALTRAFKEPHPLLGPLRLCVARLHLQALLGLTAPTGTALFVSDLVSSTHYGLPDPSSGVPLEPVLRDAVQKRAYYHLARPDLIEGLLAELAPEHRVQPISPWLWTGREQRTYLVYGFKIAGNSESG
jgi:hypothetical protein